MPRPYFWCLLLLGASALAAEPERQRYNFVEPHMGTRFQVSLYAPDEATANRAVKAAFARIAHLDAVMSDYRPTSELMQLCARAGGEPVPVSDELFHVLEKAQETARRSDGAFDVTVGPLVRLWRRARKSGELPDAEALARAKALVGYRLMHLDAPAKSVRLDKEGMQLDLGGIAKGYAADEALAVLRREGVTQALVAAGGDIAVSGPPPGAKGWKIGIAPLTHPDARPERYFLLTDGAVSTSGDAEQYVEIGGKRYSHIVDPRTGIGLVGRQSVTVVARKGIEADSLTKLVSVLGPERGIPLIEAVPGASVLVVRKTEQGEEVRRSKGFPEGR